VAAGGFPGASADEISGVTYGGSAMTEVAGSPVLHTTAGDIGNIHTFTLLASIPTGAQTVAVSVSASTALNAAECTSLTAATDTEIVDVDVSINTATATNPSVTLSLGGRTCFCLIGFFSGMAAVTGIAPVANWTARQEADLGPNTGGFYTYDVVSTVDVTAGWTQTVEDGAMIALAISEAAGAGSAPTIAHNTADAVELDSTPTLEATATDADGDRVRYNIQISASNTFPTAASGVADSNSAGSVLVVHPNPTGGLAHNGNFQVDDRPGFSFIGNGEFLDQTEWEFGAHETQPADTDGYVVTRIYATVGVYGVSNAPLNAASAANTPTPGELAISDQFPFNPGGAGTAARAIVFSGANRIRLTLGVVYMAILDWVPTSAIFTNTIAINAETTLNHAGNAYVDGNSVNWGIRVGTAADFDCRFRVFTTPLTLDKVSGTDAGFLNTVNGADTDPFVSGQKASYTVQAADALAVGTYYQRWRATDPMGTNTYSSYTATRSVTVAEAPAAESTAMDLNTRIRDYLATLYSLPATTDLTTLVSRYLREASGDRTVAWKALEVLAA
jgi:hypothetical protein